MTKQPVQPYNLQKIEEPSHKETCSSIFADEGLTEMHKRILDQLGDAAQALTTHQLESILNCRPDELALALNSLQKNGLIIKLNTIIPSYASKYPGVRLLDDTCITD